MDSWKKIQSETHWKLEGGDRREHSQTVYAGNMQDDSTKDLVVKIEEGKLLCEREKLRQVLGRSEELPETITANVIKETEGSWCAVWTERGT